jgi:RNase H-like domain found in reverse transcriptase
MPQGFNPTKHLKIATDASRVGFGCVAGYKSKKDDLMPIAFYSQKLKKHQQNYDANKLELLAIAWALMVVYIPHFNGMPFTLVTDHESLKRLWSKKELTQLEQKWYRLFANYNFTIQHIPGKLNVTTLHK